jgi:hypothetical protein
MLCMQLRGLTRMVGGMMVMPMSSMCVVRGFFVVAGFMVLGGLMVMSGSVLVVFGGFAMMLDGVLRHGGILLFTAPPKLLFQM